MRGSMTWPAGIPTPSDPRVAAALEAWVTAADPDDHAGALAAVVAAVARALEIDVDLLIEEHSVEPTPDVLAVSVDADLLRETGPWLPGFVREALLSADSRRRGGVHHTSPEMAATLIDFAATTRPFTSEDIIVDPAVGGGVFLLAACEALPGDRGDRIRQVRGLDIDPLAIATTSASLRLWARGADLPADSLHVADALHTSWPVTGATVVVGNPPFLSQLRDGTARDADRRRAMAGRWPELQGYVDDAAAFLLAAVDEVGDGGVIALVQPASFLSARDAEPVRARLAAAAALVGVWLDGGRRFAAAVDTVALVLRKGAVGASVLRGRGVPAVSLADHAAVGAGSWASLLLTGAPSLVGSSFVTGVSLGDVAHVTAGFRDQFYGLRGAVSEGVDGQPQLITSGLIDPLECRWGSVSCRFDKQRWHAPTVDPEAVDAAIHDWVGARLVPKLLVASQTKVIEVAIDTAGHMVPCTPVVSIEPLAGAPGLAHLAAALTSPLASLLLLEEAAGSALSSDAMRVSASALSRLPLPPAGAAWDAAADAVVEATSAGTPPTRSQLVEVGRFGLAAYGLGERADILDWWQSRLRGR